MSPDNFRRSPQQSSQQPSQQCDGQFRVDRSDIFIDLVTQLVAQAPTGEIRRC